MKTTSSTAHRISQMKSPAPQRGQGDSNGKCIQRPRAIKSDALYEFHCHIAKDSHHHLIVARTLWKSDSATLI